MLFLGIDLHRKQMTVSLRNERGDVVRWRRIAGHSECLVLLLN